MDTFEKVSDIIGKRFELSETKITMDTTWEEIGADSIDLVDLISELEDEFDISIPDEPVLQEKPVAGAEPVATDEQESDKKTNDADKAGTNQRDTTEAE